MTKLEYVWLTVMGRDVGVGRSRGYQKIPPKFKNEILIMKKDIRCVTGQEKNVDTSKKRKKIA